jgi:probable HAF family extracellular repeat protein
MTSDARGDRHAFLWRDGEMTDLGTLGGSFSRAESINDRGQVVGLAETATGESHAFVWQDGRMVDLGALTDGPGSSVATKITDRGHVIGSKTDRDGRVRAYRWTVPTRLGTR